MQEWQAALALLEDLLPPHFKGDGSDDNEGDDGKSWEATGEGKEFFVSSHLVRDFEIPNHISHRHKTFETVHLTFSSRFLYTLRILISWSAIFHAHQTLAAPLGLHATKTAGSQSLAVG